MNDIRFRGFDQKNLSMFPIHEMNWNKIDDSLSRVYGVDIHHKDSDWGGDVFYGGNITDKTGKHTPRQILRYVIMQFVGLFDDNGKRIFEGDIVEIWDRDETSTPYISKVYDLSYDGVSIDSHPALCKIGLDHRRNLSHFCDYGFGGKYKVSCKIIGNIYENPELREEK